MSTNKYDIDYLKKYHRGELSAREMFLLEKQAEQDDLLMDLLLGMEVKSISIHKQAVADIHSRIEDRIEAKSTHKIINWKLISIAASITVLLTVSFFLLKDNLTENEIIAQGPVPQRIPQTSVTPIDSNTNVVTFGDEEADPVVQAPTQRKTSSSRIAKLTPDKIEQQLAARDIINKQLSESRNRITSRAKPAKLKAQSSTYESQPMADNIENAPSITALASKKNVIRGVILDGENGRAINGAIIKNLDENTLFTADSLGRFAIQSDKKDPRLEALALGYEKQNLIASQSNHQIKLNPSNNEIEEVVVVGYGTQAKREVTGATSTIIINKKPVLSEPIGGWRFYQKYIKEATKLAKLSKTEVYLQFEIDYQGKPINIRVYQSGGPIADQRAVDIVRNGPEWNKGSSNNPVELKLEF